MSSPEAPMVSTAAVKPSMFWTVVWGYGMLLVFVVLVMLFIGRNAITFQDAEVVREAERIKIRDEVAVAAKKALEEGPNWLNQEKGVVHLPIDQAMALTVERLKIKKPRAANPIEVEVPAAAATSGGATTPAAAPAPPATSPAAVSPAPPK